VIAIEPPGPARQATPPATTSLEIATLLHLAELDASLIGRESVGRALVHDQMAEERRGLGARISPEILEAYDRALRTGRQPAVVPLAGSVCTGCHMRLHSKLDHQIQKRRGVAACPHCLRLVYDPAWLDGR
jgi:predicted  nucleic acid-binding Zn-ribbon protein